MTLNDWAQAPNLSALTNKIYESKKNPVVYSQVAETVNTKIKNFIAENPDSFFSIDLPALAKIKNLINKGLYKASSNEKKLRAELNQIIDRAIELAKASFIPLQPYLMQIYEEYSSMNDCVNLFILGVLSSNNLLNSINKASINEIEDFVQEAKKRHASHPHIFKQMIDAFFQHASSKTQGLFFSCLTKLSCRLEPHKTDELFFNDFISALPANITTLNLINYPFIKKYQLISIVSNLRNLRTLKIDGGQFNLQSFESIIKIIIKLPNLQKLHLQEFNFNVLGLTLIAKKTSLRSLSITSPSFPSLISYDDLIPIIASMSQLKSLHLHQVFLFSFLTSNIAKMDKLESLDLSSNPMLHIPSIAKMSNLQSLNLSKMILERNDMLSIAGMFNLKYLNLSRCILTDIDFNIVINHMPHLVSLDLSDNLVSDEIVTFITEQVGSSCLRSLNLSRCQLLTNAGAILILNHLKKLTELNLEGCDEIDTKTRELIQKKLINRKVKIGSSHK